MVTCWLLIDTIAMTGSSALRGAVASVGCAEPERFAASTGDAASAAISAAAAREIVAAGPCRRIALEDCAVVDRLVMRCSGARGLLQEGSPTQQRPGTPDGSRFAAHGQS